MADGIAFTTEEQRELLHLARESVRAAVGGEAPAEVECHRPALQQRCGAFVTLKSAGNLRGCIGNFVSDEPLYRTVQQMARASAVEDPRFFGRRIRPAEVDDLEIEISVLSPLEKTDDPLGLEIGRHGIFIRRGYRSGCLLPQVALEAGWTKEEFLSYCCAAKAQLPADSWRDGQTDVFLFTATIIGG
jgi:uncharacterized protein